MVPRPWAAIAMAGATMIACTSFSAGPPTSSGGITDAGASDSGVADVSTDGPTTAGSASCDKTKPFELHLLPSPINVGSKEYAGCLSTDGLTIIISSDRVGGNRKLFQSTRAFGSDLLAAAAWSQPTSLDTLNVGLTNNPSLSADKLTIYFNATVGTDNADLWYATRTDVGALFDEPLHVGGVITSSNENEPWVSDDGQHLYFASDRTGTSELYFATATAPHTFDNAQEMSVLNAGGGARHAPLLTSDELTIFYAATTVVSSRWTVQTATRAAKGDLFGNPYAVPELGAGGGDAYPTWVSANGCELIVQELAGNTSRLFYAKRP